MKIGPVALALQIGIDSGKWTGHDGRVLRAAFGFNSRYILTTNVAHSSGTNGRGGVETGVQNADDVQFRHSAQQAGNDVATEVLVSREFDQRAFHDVRALR